MFLKLIITKRNAEGRRIDESITLMALQLPNTINHAFAKYMTITLSRGGRNLKFKKMNINLRKTK